MKVAIVGCGGLGNVHASCYLNIPGVTVVGVHDLDEDAMLSMAERTGAKAYAAYAEMLAQSGCELVSITVPSDMHRMFAVQAAEGGKHVISEKPIALSLEDAAEMIAACERSGVRLFVGHVVRYFPEYAQMKEQVTAGAVGKVGVAHAKRAGEHPGALKAWYSDEARSGGVVLDLMIHDIDFLRWTMGEVRSVYGMRRVSGNVEYALATMVFENGAVANAEAYWGYPGPFHTKAEIAGNGGVIRSDSTKSAPLQIRQTQTAAEGKKFVEVPRSPGRMIPHERQLRDFVDCIRTGREALVTPQDAYKALELALMVMESVRTGKTIYAGEREGHYNEKA